MFLLVMTSSLAGADRHETARAPDHSTARGAKTAPHRGDRCAETPTTAGPLSVTNPASPHPPAGGPNAGGPSQYREALVGRLCAWGHPAAVDYGQGPGQKPALV